MASRRAAISGGIVSALVAVAAAYVALGLCLAQPFEDVRPGLAPVVNLGVTAVLLAVGIGTFRSVFRRLRGSAVEVHGT